MSSKLSSQSSNHGEGQDRFNARLGLMLFAVYVVAYGSFMTLAAFYPKIMAVRPFGGVNIAIIYGMSLIAGAFALSLVYLRLARGGQITDGEV